MRDLFKAIVTQASGSDLESYCGSIYLGEQPQSASYPWCVFDLVTGAHDWMFDSDYEDALVEFIIRADDADEAHQAYQYLIALYDNAKMEIDNHTHISAARGNTFFDRVETDIAGEEVWQYNVEYTFVLRKT